MAIGKALSIYGNFVAADAEREAGANYREQGVIQKALYEIAGTQVIASGQRQALEEQRQAEILASRAVAVSAAGGSVQDIDHLIADIHGEGLYRANLAMYEAETMEEEMRYKGELAKKRGRQMQKAADKRALGQTIGGLGKIYSFSGGFGGGPSTAPTPNPHTR